MARMIMGHGGTPSMALPQRKASTVNAQNTRSNVFSNALSTPSAVLGVPSGRARTR